ncbi:MAG: M15 family metallopeptidase [Oscillospiraceae bacterium]
MSIKKLAPAVFLALLLLVLVMLIGSRRAEKIPFSPAQQGSSLSSYDGVQPDNDTDNIAQAPVTPTPIPTPRPTIYKPDIDISSWEYALVNNDRNIGSYAPDVTAIRDTSQYFDTRAIDALEKFLQGARDAGFTPYINAAYRPYETQEYIFNGRASQISWDGTYTYAEAVELAKKVVSYPGTSEHQLGLCCDITDKYYSKYDASVMNRDQLDWLAEHCSEYGFILRYPADKVSLTAWDEPWHFRYVGVEAAQYITENGLCLEEFRELYE